MEKIKIVKIRNLEKNLNEILEFFNFKFKKGERVLLKPSFVNARSADSGVTTDLRILEFLIKKIQRSKAIPVVGESVGYEFNSLVFDILGLNKLIEKYNIRFVDFRKCKYKTIKTNNVIFKKVTLPEILFSVDKVINLPRLKTHMLTKLSMGMKNMMGVLPLNERRIIHVTHFDRALVELNKIVKSDLTIVDASTIMHGKGPVFGDILKANLLIAGKNVFCVDDFCTKLLNLNREEISYINEADKENLIEEYEVIGNYKKLNIEIPDYKNYKRLYWWMFFLDNLQSKLTGRSLIPFFVSNFGVRLKINKIECNKCGICLKVCPVNAIYRDKEGNFKIDFKKCKEVKCLKCYEACKERAIKIKGISKPKNE